jgi:hypothetical protein
MKELLNEIVGLIDKLGKLNPIYGSNEQIAVDHLKRLKDALGNTNDLRTLEPAFAGLEQFQLSSVAWCSQLSKDIEKIIIIYQELL